MRPALPRRVGWLPNRLLHTLACGVAAMAAACAGVVDAPWPTHVVAVEQLRALAPLRTSLRTDRRHHRDASTVVLRLHVDALGVPLRVRIEQSSGNVPSMRRPSRRCATPGSSPTAWTASRWP